MEQKIRRPVAIILAVLMAFVFIPTASYAASKGTADTITYTVEVGKKLKFDDTDFNKVCKDLTGETLDVVYFEPPASSKGRLVFDDGDDEYDVDDEDDFYYREDPSIDDIVFIPNKKYTGSFTISYEGYDVEGDRFTGKVKITVTDGSEGEADEITYTVETGDTLNFKEKDFNEVCEDLTDEELDYVTFSLPSSSKGVLWFKYDSNNEKAVKTSDKYYYNYDPSIDDVTFVPKSGFTGTVSISYKGYNVDDETFTGTIKITVEKGISEKGDINYEVDADDELDFDEDDFNDFCEDENDETLSFVSFTSLPSSTKGVLYYDYGGKKEKKVKTSDEYYYDDDPSIDDITFVPNRNFAGYVEIEFEGEDMDGDSIEGTVVIHVENEDMVANDIFLNGMAGSPVLMQKVYFNRACDELLDDKLDYVKFTLPSSTQGTLYYDYTANSGTSKVSASTKYYYEDRSPYLEKVSFVSAGIAAGTYTIKYTGYGENGGSFTGQVKINVTAKAAVTPGASSQYFSDVTADYSWAAAYIDNLYTTGIVTGITASDGTRHYSPASKITRADFLLMLCRALNISTSSTISNFSDVTPGSYYYDAVLAAKALGVVQGSDNKFSPNAIITREDAMVMALRAMTVTGNAPAPGNIADLYAYKDYSSISDYAREGVAALVKAGVITGSDGLLRPKSSLTRAETAAIIYRIKY